MLSPVRPSGLALTPPRESGYCLLMGALERLGNIAEALRGYESLRLRLREELSTVPPRSIIAAESYAGS